MNNWTRTPIHREIMGLARCDRRTVDHIDKNPLNNARSNLRVATYAENMWNRGKQSNNTSGYKGVLWIERIKRWSARISANGKRYYLGHYKTAEEAHEAYKAAAERLHGEFANFG
ncbi:hypothetical protein CBA19CS22_37900 [Caballeronia novacaledonica]|uniref:Uncharacterized protein n=1 Tax=Caballeronia novacaledonica TaxID=1544861 RepID=A0ACB5R5Z7_9BURK|nr:hypothetical protein CBA19CS22_37900 [Caballeronia novacaledonica]